jgi:hypothetical protein
MCNGSVIHLFSIRKENHKDIRSRYAMAQEFTCFCLIYSKPFALFTQPVPPFCLKGSSDVYRKLCQSLCHLSLPHFCSDISLLSALGVTKSQFMISHGSQHSYTSCSRLNVICILKGKGRTPMGLVRFECFSFFFPFFFFFLFFETVPC